jgi:8-oxo-dGTP pyrophosphatase MutT (NUDIX family)/phosphohistidine phosphatase SixA
VPGHTVEAAGGALWRRAGDGLELALVHRPKYDDWSLPKGKAERGEHLLTTAVREVTEETGAIATPARRLGRTRYLVDGARKRVTYWAMRYESGAFAPSREVDQVAWLAPEEALDRLHPGHDRPIVEELLRDPRPTRAAVVVRHASAGSRKRWHGPDERRPLDKRGRRQAIGLVPLLLAYGATRAVSADVRRCEQTLAPWAQVAGLPIEPEPLLSEQGYGDSPRAADRRLIALLRAFGPVAFCTQRGALTDLVENACRALGQEVRLGPVRKGGLVVLHLTTGRQPTLVAVDELPPVPT